MKGILSLRGFRKLRTGVIVATGVFLFATSNVQVVQASEEDGVWEARTVEQVKADIASLAKDSNYVIKWGDTLSVISEATGISMDALAQMNQISNINLIYAHNELGFTQPISTTTGNQTVSKQTVTVINRQNKQEEVKAFEVTTKEDTQSGKTETVVTEVKPTTKEEKAVSKTEKAPVVTAKEETSKVNQTLVSSQPAEKAATIDKKETAKVDSTPATTGKVEAQKAEQAPAVEKPIETPAATEAKQTDTKPDEASKAVEKPTETPVITESKESTPSNPVEEKKQTEGTTSKETTKGEVDKKETTSPTDNKENSTSEEAPTSPTPAAEPEEKVESSAPTTTGKESTTVEKQTDTNKEQEPAAEKPAGTSVATEAKETTPSNQTEEKADKHIEQPATNTPSKDSVENNEIAPSANNDSNEVASHEEGKKDATVVPKEVTKENKDALDSHKQNKLHEINESSLTSEQKEQAVTKVKELTTKAEKAIDEATTSEDQAKVVDQYEKDLIAIETPNVETPKPDFTKPVESHNPSGSTTIGEGGAISTLASSAPAASEQATSTPTTSAPAVSTPTATNPSASETSTSNTSSGNTGFRNAPAYQPRVVRRARSVDSPKDQVAIYYNFVEMKDIAGFLGDPGESIITVPAGSTSEQIRTIVKAKIDAKKAELAKRGYTFTEDYFVDKPQEDTVRYDYVVNFTKAASLRVAPVSQPRAARHRRSVVESPVKTRTITVYYQLAGLEIAGALGTPGKNYVITVPETASATEIQQAIDDATRTEKAELGRFFKYVRETNLQTDILNRGFGNFDYVITFTR